MFNWLARQWELPVSSTAETATHWTAGAYRSHACRPAPKFLLVNERVTRLARWPVRPLAPLTLKLQEMGDRHADIGAARREPVRYFAAHR